MSNRPLTLQELDDACARIMGWELTYDSLLTEAWSSPGCYMHRDLWHPTVDKTGGQIGRLFAWFHDLGGDIETSEITVEGGGREWLVSAWGPSDNTWGSHQTDPSWRVAFCRAILQELEHTTCW